VGETESVELQREMADRVEEYSVTVQQRLSLENFCRVSIPKAIGKKTADALDAFAAFEVNLLLFGEGRVAWGVGRYALGPVVRATFTRGTIQSIILKRPMLAFRYTSEGVSEAGSFLTTADTVAQISSPQSASIALKLPAYNTAEQLNEFVIPAGTRIYYGGVAGGADIATQIFVDDATVLVPYP